MNKLAEIIQDQANASPDKIIAADYEQEYTWSEFFNLVEKFRKLLGSVKGNSKLICFYAERNVYSVAVMIACIFDNLIFIPIDPEQPRSRVLKIMETAGVNSVIKPSLINFDINLEVTEVFKAKPADDTCYILFTSGSSGSPKAVEITYSNLMNTLMWGLKRFSWNSFDKIGIPTKFSFDISLFDVFTRMITSTPFYVFKNVSNPIELLAEVVKNRITSIFSTPSLFVMMKSHNFFKESHIRRIIAGGDFFPSNSLIEIVENFPSLEVHNIWGPTETTILNTSHQVSEKDLALLKEKNLVPVGKPSKEMQIVIANINNSEVLEVLATNQIGEIIVIGESVSPGYFNFGDSQEKSKFCQYLGRKAYRTGDIGFLDESDNLYLVGRNNQFIKYQGFRIDPREIEFIVDSNPNIAKSVLTINTLPTGQVNLVLIVEMQTGKTLEESAIKLALRSKLPKYMIPKIILDVSKIPLSANGKIDRKAAELLVAEAFESK